MQLTAQQSQAVEEARVAVQMAVEARDGLRIGVAPSTVDVKRIIIAQGHMIAANVAWERNDWRMMERNIGWARHYAITAIPAR